MPMPIYMIEDHSLKIPSRIPEELKNVPMDQLTVAQVSELRNLKNKEDSLLDNIMFGICMTFLAAILVAIGYLIWDTLKNR